MSAKNDTRMPQEILERLANDPNLGAGNFLHVVEKLNPNSEEDLIWLDREIKLFSATYSRFSLSSLKQVAEKYAAWYADNGVQERDPIAVYVDNNFKYSIHFVALTTLGAIPVLINGNVPPEIAALFMGKVGAVGLFTDESHYDRIAPHLEGKSELKFKTTDDRIAPTSAPLPSWYPYKHDQDDPVLICHSSGTTGIPKAVINHHHQYFFGPRYRMTSPLRNAPQRALSTFPHSHSAGVSFPMRAMLTGTPIMIVSDQEPDNILRNIEEFQPTRVGAFAEVYAKLSKCELGKYNLSSVRTWLNTGDSAHEAHIRPLVNVGSHDVGDKVLPGSTFVDGLGSSEMGYSMFKKEHTKDSGSFGRCVGTPFEFVEAQVIGDNGELLGPNEVGYFGFKSPSITPGYWNDSVTTYRSQRNGFWMPGDVGYRDKDGQFYHLDRAVDVIHTTAGDVYTLPTEEKIQNTYPEVYDCTVIGVDAPSGKSCPLAIVWGDEGAKLKAEELLRNLNERFSNGNGRPFLSAVVVVDHDKVPVGATGKILKRHLRESYKQFIVDPATRKKMAANFAVA